MASSQTIKSFIARWLQLGKSVERLDGSVSFSPSKILGYRGYSQEFEEWWKTFEKTSQKWALSGTREPLSALYSPSWEIISCARCDMPVPMRVAGLNDGDCPCSDLPYWPDLEIPLPHAPAHSNSRLQDICKRLGPSAV
ncbi:MAG: hypothetical protein AAGB01_09000 [Cyanobacteria bacterium P01_F01_bin.42]